MYNYNKFEFISSQKSLNLLVLFNCNKVILKYLSKNKN